MKIGISTSVIQGGKTGVAQYLFSLLKALVALRTEHKFYLFVLEADKPLLEFAAPDMTIITVPETFRPPVRNILWHQTALPRIARELRLDVMHVPSYRRMLWPHPCALVATIHDLAPFHVANKYDWKRMVYGRVVARRLAHRQNQIIAISENTARDIVTYFKIPAERITVVHNGIDHKRFTPGDPEAARQEVQNKFGINTPFFLYVARLEHPAKNHVRLIEAFDQFKERTGSDWKLVFGGTDWHGAEAIHQRIRSSKFMRDIHSLGFVDAAALPTMYRAADAFVYPSLYEGFGLPPAEAMACGCPVISSACGSLAEVVGDSALIVDPQSIDSMEQALARVATEPDLRQKLRAAGLCQSKKFDWHKAAIATMSVYERAGISATRSHRIPVTKLETTPCGIHGE